ncbi:hypothetical protein PQU92_13975 [Asticcacaulis sp. BYS171W]|uniref:Uncharacterized protein n=1 Tax=Asticcacaulis aquaticus TaxID=2984212 RepID=A0ABT5HWE6_9CAUL|nr:hypothetical protein [Asticcacaulis aquaticus]MDC7684390.1 hypothetical protein [Asticcacaulis aquaticus]
MQSVSRSQFSVWAERLTIVALTTSFHHFPVPTIALVALMLAARVGRLKPPPEFRDWR